MTRGLCQQRELLSPRLLTSLSRSAPLLYNRAVVLGALGRAEDAMTSYRTAIKYKPDFAAAMCNLAILVRREEARVAIIQCRISHPVCSVKCVHWEMNMCILRHDTVTHTCDLTP